MEQQIIDGLNEIKVLLLMIFIPIWYLCVDHIYGKTNEYKKLKEEENELENQESSEI